MSGLQNAYILADSMNPSGQRLTTFLLPRFAKCLLAQLNTHRMLSRNAASSRAIPLKRMIANIKADMFVPIWTRKQAGMGGEVIHDPGLKALLEVEWREQFEQCAERAQGLHEYGTSKEVCNRLIEPWARVPVIITSTTWQNFFDLRTHDGAQADFREVALEMRSMLAESLPKALEWDEWHLPFSESLEGSGALMHSVACCARCSYYNFDGNESRESDQALFLKLRESGHWSPFEHQAFAREGQHANFFGWQSLRNDLGA